MSRPLRPPQGGTPPPEEATLPDGAAVALRPLAEEICRRYRSAYPDEQERYGDAGVAWCIHDNQHILNWAFLSVQHDERLLEEQIAWLAGVLSARDFPLERLEHDLELAAEVLRESQPGSAVAADALERARDGQLRALEEELPREQGAVQLALGEDALEAQARFHRSRSRLSPPFDSCFCSGILESTGD